MNKYVVGGFLAFAFGVAAITTAYTKLGIEPVAQRVNDALSGQSNTDKDTIKKDVKPVEKTASNPAGLAEYKPD